MPKVAYRWMLFLFWLSNGALAQNCARSGSPAWSEQLRNVIAECENRVTSPDGKLSLDIDAKGRIRVFEVSSESEVEIHSRAVEPPAMVSWSPKTDAFFVNDGEGSGMSSTFRLFRVSGNKIVEDVTIERKAVELYRREMKCSSAAADPSVWGLGWSSDGGRFFLLIQSTVNDSCGTAGSFISITVKLTDGTILARMSEQETKRSLGSLLPRELYSK